LLDGSEEGHEEPVRLTVVEHSNQAFSDICYEDKAQADWTESICVLSLHTVLLVAKESY